MSKATSLALQNKMSSHQAKVDLTSHRHGLYSGEADGFLSLRALCSVLPLDPCLCHSPAENTLRGSHCH